MNVLICCAGGMSSSLLVQKMRDEIKSREINHIKVGACAISQLHQYIKEADILLVAPQVNFISSQLDNQDIPVFYITSEEYGTLNASSLLDRILTGEKENKSPLKPQTFLDKVYEHLTPLATKISLSKFLDAISRSFISIMPISTVGSIFMLLENLSFQSYTDFLETSGLSHLFDLVTGATIDVISVYLVFFIAYNYVRSHDEHGHPAGLLALICFFLITGQTNGTYLSTYLGNKGIFSAIFIGLVTGKLYLFILKHQTFKLTKSIPLEIYHSISAVFPSMVIIVAFMIIAGIMKETSYGNLHNLLYALLQTTFSKYLSNNIISYVFVSLSTNLLWFFGIHGGNVLNSITSPIYYPLAMENFSLYCQGLEPVNIITNCFAKCFISGGVGSMFSLSILMAFFSKSEQYKTLGRIALPTTFFYINEPLLFGIPIIMNPLYFIPLIFITPTLSVLTYTVMKLGFVPITRGIQLPWTTPPFIYGFLQGGIKLALWEGLCILIAMLCWYPFFRIGDKEAYLKEHQEDKR